MTRFVRSLLILGVIAGCSDSLGPEDYYAVWGAEGVQLTLSATQARFETSCWAGDMAIPIQVDGSQFTAIGTVNWQGGAGGMESSAVILIGHLDGDTMRLTVHASFALGPYVLHRGEQVQIPGCP